MHRLVYQIFRNTQHGVSVISDRSGNKNGKWDGGVAETNVMTIIGWQHNVATPYKFRNRSPQERKWFNHCRKRGRYASSGPIGSGIVSELEAMFRTVPR